VRRFIEQRLRPVVRRSVFGPPNSPGALCEVAGRLAMELVERRLVPPLGHFSLIRFRKTGYGRRRLARASSVR
jgi:phosphatidylethanolamine/phosphatidyl-N-methylethanolamine N-methyltransferase